MLWKKSVTSFFSTVFSQKIQLSIWRFAMDVWMEMAEVVCRKLEEKAKRNYCSGFSMVQIPTFFSTHLISMIVIITNFPHLVLQTGGQKRPSPISRRLMKAPSTQLFQCKGPMQTFSPSGLANRWAEDRFNEACNFIQWISVQRINAKDSGQRVKDFHFAKDSGIKNGDEVTFI